MGKHKRQRQSWKRVDLEPSRGDLLSLHKKGSRAMKKEGLHSAIAGMIIKNNIRNHEERRRGRDQRGFWFLVRRRLGQEGNERKKLREEHLHSTQDWKRAIWTGCRGRHGGALAGDGGKKSA